MAGIAGITGIAGLWRLPRWTLAGLTWKSPKSSKAAALTAEAAVERPELRKRRSYAPPRDAFLENSSMRREMYRL